jgi:hypothetical protein
MERGTNSSIKTSTSVKTSETKKQQHEETVSHTVEVNGRKETTATTTKITSSVKVSLEITNTVERCESAYIKHIQKEETEKAKHPPLQLSVPAFAKMLGQASTKGPFVPSSSAVNSPLKLTSNWGINTRMFMERMLYLGVVPPECHLWEFMACRVHKVPEGRGGGAAGHPGGQGYAFDDRFPDIREPSNAFEHILNKCNDLDQSYGHVWPTTWVQITLSSRERVLLPVYFALYVFKDNEVAVRVIENAVVPDAYRIMGSVISTCNGIDFGGGISTVTLEDGTEKRYMYHKEKLDIPELQELRDLAYRQKQELEHEVLVERPRRIAEAERQEEEKKDHWYREQQRLGQDRRPRAPDTPRVKQ